MAFHRGDIDDFLEPYILSIVFLTPDLSSSESDEELSSPSYANFLHFDQKPVYSDVVKKQMVSITTVCILHLDKHKHSLLYFDAKIGSS